MPTTNLFETEPHLLLWIKSPERNPLTLKLETAKIIALGAIVAGVFCVLFVGSLLYFREVEINRKLTDQLISLRIENKSLRISPTPDSGVIPQPIENTEGSKIREVSDATQTEITARLSEVTSECSQGICTARVGLVPSRTGVAEGHLLLVLEAEVPRIGTGNTTSQVRKRFFVYPGGTELSEFPEDALIQTSKKSFRFSRALQTTATFNVGKLLRPLALNVYIYDGNQTLIHHERKAIETE